MKVSTAWIKEWLCRTMSDKEIVSALEQAGIEVEQTIYSKPLDKKIVVALVKKVIQHPGADRLKIVFVSTGKEELRIVCGAPNVREGLKVALAQVGTTLPSGDKIMPAKLRGEVSEGMLCSERELDLGPDHDGILELPDSAEPGTTLCDMYPSDAIVDIKTQTNRFDLLSVVGLAREVGAITGAGSKELPEGLHADKTGGPEVAPKVGAKRFMLVRMKVAADAPSPDWMVARLRAAGVRSISPIVDVTNYVNLELGQPLHAYDATKVKLPLTVRLAKAHERLTTLDGVKRKLETDDMVVADATGPVGLAGVMGGVSTEVDDTTKEILLEAATFDGVLVRKMAKRHGLRTEASARFERGLPVQLAPVAMARAVELLTQVAGGLLVAVTDQLNVAPQERPIELRHDFLNRLLGFEVTMKEAVAALGQLQIEAQPADSAEIIAVPAVPWWRPDLKEAQDLVEEVVRVLGYDRVPSRIPVWRPRQVSFDHMHGRRRQLQRVLYGAGLFEVMTYSFVSQDQLADLELDARQHLKLKNPLSVEQAYLRSSLLPSHLQVLARNRTYAKTVGFYELSRVFEKRGSGEQPAEPLRLGVMVRRPELAYRQLKGILDALARELGLELKVAPETSAEVGWAAGRRATVWLGKLRLGQIGQLDPALLRRLKLGGEAAYLELNVAPLLEQARPRVFQGLARFPSAQRDLAVIVPAEVMWADVTAALADLPQATAAFVEDYYGEGVPTGHKSLTIRLTVRHTDRTPTDGEAAAVEAKALRILERKFGAQPRAEG